MTELSLVGVHENGTQVILSDSEGREFLLPITDDLRSAVRRDHLMVERLRGSSEPATPRTIQAMLRAGATVDEVAEATSLTREHVERYESPVVAERAWVIQQAQELTVGRHPDSPTLGDLAIDRLATRKVSPEELEWSAVRGESGPWTLALSFPVAGRIEEATWEVDLQSRALHATNDEARWLSETDASSPRGRAVYTPLPTAEPVAEPEDATDTLLTSLAEARGVRQSVEFGDDPDLLDELDEAEEERTPAPVVELRRKDTQPEVREPEPDPEPEPEKPAKPTRRSSRRSVPSWDEIVFGSKSD